MRFKIINGEIKDSKLKINPIHEYLKGYIPPRCKGHKQCDKLNILDENGKLKNENGKLKKQALQLAKVNHENDEKVQSLANKNKQLKQDKQALMDLYEKYLSSHINISLRFLND